MQTIRYTSLVLGFFCLSACAGYDAPGVSSTEESMSEGDAALTDAPAPSASAVVPVAEEASVPKSAEGSVLSKYAYLDPGHVVPTDLLTKAVLYYDANSAKIANKNYLSVIDFAKRSTLARFFIIDMKTGAVWAIHNAHGKGSDANHDGYAESFSNVSGSNATSLGVYKTAETYSGSHGLSLRLDGLSSTNSNARARAIVLHGADYVSESAVIQGRSWGCPAVSMGNRDKVIGMLKGGSVIYAGLSGK